MYSDKVYIREEEVDGVESWHWAVGDNGTWQGPAQEWPALRDMILSHRPEEKRRTIIQAGGALGMYPRLWANHFKRVFTFEPSPLSFHILNLNCQMDNIYKFNACLGHTHDPLILNQDCPDNRGMNRVGDAENENSVSVLTLRVDDFELNDLDVLQLDIEGWERNALFGAEATIKRSHPVIALETVDSQIEAFLFGLGYKPIGRGGYDQVFLHSTDF